MNLEESTRDWVIANLPHDRADAATVDALQAKQTGELLMLFFNWADRLIAPRPRQVVRSSAFDQSFAALARPTVIDTIVADVESGQDLTKYLRVA